MGRVTLVEPCFAPVLSPGESDHARKVLEALGDSVEALRGRCCGQPAYNSGYRDDAKAVGRELLRAAAVGGTFVLPSGSCTSMVRHYLPGLFEGERHTRAAAIAAQFIEFTEYVAQHEALDSIRLQLEGDVAYHDACHFRRELGASGAALGLLKRIEGLTVHRLANEDECCGFGGTFSAKLPEVSGEMRAAKLGAIAATGASVLVSTDRSCLAHLAAGAGGNIETWTVAELLARALP